MMKYSRRTVRIEQKAATVLLTSMCCLVPCFAQDSSSSGASGSTDGAPESGPLLNVHRGNSLEDLFTGQRQFPTPQTLLNPQPTAPAAGETNPLRNLFTPMRQWSTPQTLQDPQADPPDGEVNHLKNVFTPPNQWSTPQTVLNPQPTPRNYVPERQLFWGPDDERDALLLQHSANTYGGAMPPQASPASAPARQALKPLAPAQKSKKDQSGKAAGAGAGSNAAAAGQAEAGKQSLTAPNPVAPPAENSLKTSLSLIRSGNNERSLQLLNQIIHDHPDDAEAQYLKAVVLVRTKQYKMAADAYNSVIRLKPNTLLSSYAQQGLSKIGF